MFTMLAAAAIVASPVDSYQLPEQTPTEAPTQNVVEPADPLPFTDLTPAQWEKRIDNRNKAIVALNVIDAIQTIECVHNSHGQCYEGNPLYGKHPSVPRILAHKTGEVVANLLITDWIKDHHPNLVDEWQWASIAFIGAIVSRNVAVRAKW